MTLLIARTGANLKKYMRNKYNPEPSMRKRNMMNNINLAMIVKSVRIALCAH